MVRRIRAPEFRAIYQAQYRDYLKSTTGCMAALIARGGIFAASKVAQLYVLDVDNQFGSGRSRDLAKFAITLDRNDPNNSEMQMRDFMIATTAYGKTTDGAHDIGRRFNNIRAIVGTHDVAGTGNKKNCAVNNLK